MVVAINYPHSGIYVAILYLWIVSIIFPSFTTCDSVSSSYVSMYNPLQQLVNFPIYRMQTVAAQFSEQTLKFAFERTCFKTISEVSAARGKPQDAAACDYVNTNMGISFAFFRLLSCRNSRITEAVLNKLMPPRWWKRCEKISSTCWTGRRQQSNELLWKVKRFPHNIIMVSRLYRHGALCNAINLLPPGCRERNWLRWILQHEVTLRRAVQKSRQFRSLQFKVARP